MCTNITQTLKASGHVIFFLIPIPSTSPYRKQGSTSNLIATIINITMEAYKWKNPFHYSFQSQL